MDIKFIITGILIIVVLIIAILFLKKKEKSIDKNNNKVIKTEENNNIKIKEEFPEPIPDIPESLKKLQTNRNSLKSYIQEGIKKASEEYGMSEKEIESELLSDLYNQIETAKNNLYKGIEENNYELVEKEAHSLKGAALNLKIDILGNAFKEVNDRVRQKEDLKVIKIYLDIIYKAMDKII